jgi:hypothetical protein
LPSLSNGVIIGKFKRGRMDKPFKVTASNYQALLGRDPSNPSYLAVEDCFKRGVSEVSILRVGSVGGGGGVLPVSKINYINITEPPMMVSSIRFEEGYGVAACLKVQINDSVPQVESFVVDPYKLTFPEVNADQVALSFLLQRFAGGDFPWGYNVIPAP